MANWPTNLFRDEGGDVIIAIEVQPASKRAGIEGVNPWRERLQITVKEPPLKGAANEAVCELISEKFQIPLVYVSIESGHKSRQKSVRIKGSKRLDIESQLKVLLEEN